MAGEVVLLDTWVSMFGMRVRIALAEKGVQYEYKEQDLGNKSELLRKMNPVHKKISVLIHTGNRSASPSSLFSTSMEYGGTGVRSFRRIWATKGEEQEAAKKDFIEGFKILEGDVGDKPYFGGENFGFVDLALITFYSWFFVFETFGKFSVEPECPKIVQWAKRCLQRESVAKTLPDQKKVYEFVLEFRKWLGVE